MINVAAVVQPLFSCFDLGASLRIADCSAGSLERINRWGRPAAASRINLGLFASTSAIVSRRAGNRSAPGPIHVRKAGKRRRRPRPMTGQAACRLGLGHVSCDLGLASAPNNFSVLYVAASLILRWRSLSARETSR